MVRVGPETVKLLSHFLSFWGDYYKVYSVIVRPVHCMRSHKRPQKQKLDDERTHSVYSVCTVLSDVTDSVYMTAVSNDEPPPH